MGKVQKKVKKKTNNSAFSATHTYIKLTLVSFFYVFFYAPFPKGFLAKDHKKYVFFFRNPSLRKMCTQKKEEKKLTSVSFMYVCVAGNGEMLVFFLPFFPQQ